jgi:hypothetical protein
MKTDYDPFSEDNLARVRAKQQTRTTTPAEEASIKNNGKKPRDKQRKSPKKSGIEFLKLDPITLRKLAHTHARWIAWTTFFALSEAWFTSGICTGHLNPFPLSTVDTKKWGLNRMQKFRALRFLMKNHFIAIDRSDPKNPSVTLLWLPLQP